MAADIEHASTKPYTQLPLNTTKRPIRLLKVLRTGSETAKCTLEVFDLDAASPSVHCGILQMGLARC
jgi:hypothetical protein